MTSFRRESAPPRLQLHLESGGTAVPSSPILSRQSFGLTFSRGWLVRIANETVQVAQKGYYHNRQGNKVDIQQALHYSMENSIHYHSSHTFHPTQTLPPHTPFDDQPTEFHVCYGSSLQVARRLREQLEGLYCNSEELPYSTTERKGIHIGVLNSASGKRPEKFLRGTLSQEEGICRASLLYPCLLQYYNRPHHFYYVNHKPKYHESPSSCAIYSPKVPMIRDDTMRGDLLDDYETYSFVSIPAPNAFALGGQEDEEAVIPKAQPPGSSDNEEPYETMTIQAAMHDRIYRALSIFAENGCTDLVLCAFGCGVHGNDPYQIAVCFQEILSSPEFKGRFRTVAFGIHPSRQQNYEQFIKVFGDGGVDSNTSSSISGEESSGEEHEHEHEHQHEVITNQTRLLWDEPKRESCQW